MLRRQLTIVDLKGLQLVGVVELVSPSDIFPAFKVMLGFQRGCVRCRTKFWC